MRMRLGKHVIINMMNEEEEWQDEQVLDYTYDCSLGQYLIKHQPRYYANYSIMRVGRGQFIDYLKDLLLRKGFMNIFLEVMNDGSFKLECVEEKHGRRRKR